MNRMRRFLVGIGVNLLVLIPVIALPQLINNGTITLVEGFFIVETVILALTYLVVRTFPGKGKNSLKLKAGGFIFTFISVIVLSLMYLTTVKTPPNWFLILIPINVVIMAIPIYLYYVNGKPPNLSAAEYSDKYTSILREMFPESANQGHDVYTSGRINNRRFASTTNGNNWKISLNVDAVTELNDGEMKMLLAETYLTRESNIALKLVSLGGALVAIYIDLLIAMPVLKNMFPPLSMLFLGVAIASFALLISLPFYIIALFTRSTLKVDRKVVSRFGNPKDLKEVIRKTSEIRVPPPTLTARQLENYNRRKEKNLARRINAIEKTVTN